MYFLGIMGSSEGNSREFKESGSRVRDPNKEVFFVSSNSASLGSDLFSFTNFSSEGGSTDLSTFFDILSKQVANNIAQSINKVAKDNVNIAVRVSQQQKGAKEGQHESLTKLVP